MTPAEKYYYDQLGTPTEEGKKVPIYVLPTIDDVDEGTHCESVELEGYEVVFEAQRTGVILDWVIIYRSKN